MGFLMLTVFASQRRTQNDVTRLTRAIALQNVRIPDSATPPVLPASAEGEPQPLPPTEKRPRGGLAIFAITAVAIAWHCVLLFRFCGLSYDQLYQMAASRALLSGHGYSLAYADSSNWMAIKWSGVVGWPF